MNNDTRCHHLRQHPHFTIPRGVGVYVPSPRFRKYALLRLRSAPIHPLPTRQFHKSRRLATVHVTLVVYVEPSTTRDRNNVSRRRVSAACRRFPTRLLSTQQNNRFRFIGTQTSFSSSLLGASSSSSSPEEAIIRSEPGSDSNSSESESESTPERNACVNASSDSSQPGVRGGSGSELRLSNNAPSSSKKLVNSVSTQNVNVSSSVHMKIKNGRDNAVMGGRGCANHKTWVNGFISNHRV